MKAKIIRLDPSIELPKYHTSESAGFDVASNEEKIIAAGEVAEIKTGLVIEAPEGHFLCLAPRGSLGKKKGIQLINSIGVVDRDYAGPKDEIFLSVRNFTDQPVSIAKGERLVQGIFIKIDQVEWEESDSIREADRGGYGSTGGYKS